jgi:hypothetical protein
MNPNILVWNLLSILLVSVTICSCTSEVEEREFVARYQQLSNRRIQFRLNMKALGDSTKRQRKFVLSVLKEIQADTSFEKKIDISYALWSDSLRKKMLDGQAYFETQFTKNRPLIRQWEKSEMQLDGMVQRIKNGDLSEEAGLDSINTMLLNLDSLIIRSDSLLKTSNRHYWAFRKDLEEYRYNARNLKILYSKKK